MNRATAHAVGLLALGTALFWGGRPALGQGDVQCLPELYEQCENGPQNCLEPATCNDAVETLPFNCCNTPSPGYCCQYLCPTFQCPWACKTGQVGNLVLLGPCVAWPPFIPPSGNLRLGVSGPNANSQCRVQGTCLPND